MLRNALWKQLSNIDLYNLDPDLPHQIDLVISGGGFLGYYLVGLDRVLKKIQKNHRVHVQRYAGSSVGAFASVAMICCLGDYMIPLYDQLQEDAHFFFKIREYFLHILPPDAFVQCTGRVFVVITRVRFVYGILPVFHKMVVSQFESNEDLVDACMASSNFPFFISPRLFYPYRGCLCMDGVLTRHRPVFEDRVRPQLLVSLDRIPYSWRCIFTPFKNLVLPLIVKGALETEMLFLNYPQDVGALQWYRRATRQQKRSWFRVSFLRKYLIFGLSRLSRGVVSFLEIYRARSRLLGL